MAETFEPIQNDWTFEKLLEELESVIKQLEEGKLPLDKALSFYSRGVELRKKCEERLTQAQLTIEKLQPTTPSREG